jgi:hypothetical protein
LSNFLLVPKGRVCLEFCFSRPVEFLTVVNCLSVGAILRTIGKLRAAYHNGVRDFQSFSQSEDQKLSSVQPLLSRTKLNSEADLQNPITPKPFSGQSHMSNG